MTVTIVLINTCLLVTWTPLFARFILEELLKRDVVRVDTFSTYARVRVFRVWSDLLYFSYFWLDGLVFMLRSKKIRDYLLKRQTQQSHVHSTTATDLICMGSMLSIAYNVDVRRGSAMPAKIIALNSNPMRVK